MAQRKHKGNPIDLTNLPGEQHISERKNGETVDGTTEDDMHQENTEVWPSVLDKDEFSDLQTEVIKRLCLNPSSAYSGVADAVGCSETVVYRARKKIADMGVADEVPFDVMRDKDYENNGNGVAMTAKDWFIDKMSDDPSATPSEIAEQVPEGEEWTSQNYHNVMRAGKGRKELKEAIIKKGNWDKVGPKIREKLKDTPVDVEVPTTNPEEANTEPTDESAQEAETDRVQELESAVSELTKRLATDSNVKDIVPSVVDELDDATVSDAVVTVIQNE